MVFAMCEYCSYELKTKTELKSRKDPYPILNKDNRFHLLCDPCKDV